MPPRAATEPKPSSSQPWTASRCLRLLRPISSRAEPLRRLAREDALGETPAGIDARPTGQGAATASPTSPVWAQQHPAKARRTYSSRNRAGKHSSAPQAGEHRGNARRRCHTGNDAASRPRAAKDQCRSPAGRDDVVELPTPFRAQTADFWTQEPTSPLPDRGAELQSSPVAPAPTSRNSVGGWGFANWNVGRSTPRGQKRAELENGIVRGLVALMERTADGIESRKATKGAPGLMAMCLRAVPRAIRMETEHRKMLDPDKNADVAAEIYSELERWGPRAAAGYAGLRQVVRAHGLGLVLDMFRRGELSDEAMDKVFRVVKQFGSGREMSLMRKELLFASSKWNAHLGGRVCSLEEMRLEKENIKAVQVLSATMIGQAVQNGAVEWELFAAEQWTTWIETQSKAVGRSVEGEQLAGLGMILEAACVGIPSSAGGSRNHEPRPSASASTKLLVVRRSLERIINMLSAMAIIACRSESEQWKARIGSQIRTMLSVVSTAILRQSSQTPGSACLNDRFYKHRPVLVVRLLTSVLALQLLDTALDADHASFPERTLVNTLHLWSSKSLGSPPGSIETNMIADILVALSWSCGFLDQSSGEALIKRIIDRLLETAKDLERKDSRFLKLIALQTAQTFAVRHSSKSARIMARDVESIVQDSNSSLLLPDTDMPESRFDELSGSSFAWDDGLQEWLAAAPAYVSREPQSGSVSINGDSSILSNRDQPRTPDRKRRLPIITSPDELGDNPTLFAVDDAHHTNDSLSEEMEPSACASTSEPQSPPSPKFQIVESDVLVAEETTEGHISDREENWDELAMSPRKRRAPSIPVALPAIRLAKRQRRLVKADESDDELGAQA